MAYTLLLLFDCMITLEMFLFPSPSLHLELHTLKKIRISENSIWLSEFFTIGNPKSDYFMADKKLAPETD